MPTLTIELPDAAYRAALAFLPSERTRLASVTFLTAESTLDEWNPATSTEQINALRQAIDEEEAGQDLDGDVFMADLRRKRSEARQKMSTDSKTL